MELLDAGIHVYTTLNIQHLESLNDVVTQITGVVVRETIPDSVLEQADEVELIDLPPEDLLQRLKEGKVYVPEQAAEAVKSFFRKGNLIALRELALRRTADSVDVQMRHYMRDHAIRKTWPVTERLIACVGSGPHSVRVVAGRQAVRGFPPGGVDRRVCGDARSRSSDGRRSGPGGGHPPSRGTARGRDGCLERPYGEPRNPGACAAPQRQQDRRRKARAPSLATPAVRHYRGRTDPRSRRDGRVCHQRGGVLQRSLCSPAPAGGRWLGTVRPSRRDRHALHRSGLDHVPLL